MGFECGRNAKPDTETVRASCVRDAIDRVLDTGMLEVDSTTGLHTCGALEQIFGTRARPGGVCSIVYTDRRTRRHDDSGNQLLRCTGCSRTALAA
jgi:hypothetical protein